MYADIEALVLSGELFNGNSRSSSPARSPSPDAGWHDDELTSDVETQGYDPDVRPQQVESIGMGPGRTGVKGVIRDRNEAEGLGREKWAREAEEVRVRLEKSHLGGKTFLEEEREKAALGLDGPVDELVAREREKEAGRRDVFGVQREGQFGHLREVGVKGFVSAVEKEQSGVWVVVHIYEPSLERCYQTDDTLSRLARLFPDTKFLRARASALGFASTAKPLPVSRTTHSRPSASLRDRDDDEDPYSEKEYEDYDDDESVDDDNVDLDMLPTMLVYRDGELVHNWVRIDWEASRAGIEELLDRHHILPQSDLLHTGKLGFPSDDDDNDDELLWDD